MRELNGAFACLIISDLFGEGFEDSGCRIKTDVIF